MFKIFKKIVLILTLLFIFNLNNIYAKDKLEVTLSKCVDGDTAYFMINDKKTKVRFLAIDTPESTNKIDPYGKEASEFVCNLLTSASKIELEYDVDKVDKYDRTLAWVFVDDKLLQDTVVQNGLAEVAYLYKDYKYTDRLQASEKIAKEKKLNIWSDYESNNMLVIVIAIIIIVVLCIFSSKVRGKVKKKINRKINTEIDKLFK